MKSKQYTTKEQRQILESIGVHHVKGRSYDEAKELIEQLKKTGRLPRNILSPATEKQLDFLARHNIAAPTDITEEEADEVMGPKKAELDLVTPISDRQYDFIIRLGGVPSKSMNRDQASKFIEYLMDNRERCRKCGAEYDHRSKRCPTCGGFLPQLSPVHPPSNIFTRKGVVDQLADFCFQSMDKRTYDIVLVSLLAIACVLLAVITWAVAFREPNRSAESPPLVTTVSSLADVTRRLELRGYSYVEESNSYGQHFVHYAKHTSDVAYFVEVIRWSGDQRLKRLIFHGSTSETGFNSNEVRRGIWDAINADACAMINGKQDYFLALADMKEVDGDGLSRFAGRATTAEGWRIEAIEYVGYYKIEAGTIENKIGVAMVNLTNLETSEDMPASAELEFDRQFEQAKKR
jgi:hypothetical protein